MGRSRLTSESRRTTLRDVALAAEVSVATVSYVLNNKHTDRVSPSTRRRVQLAIESLNYTPNATARSLVTNCSKTLGVYLPQALERVLVEPGTDRLLSGIMQKAALEDYQLIVAMEGSDPKASAVDGWLCLRAPAPIGILEKRALPLIYVDPLFECESRALEPAHTRAGEILGEYLRSRVKRVALVHHCPKGELSYGVRKRFDALKSALAPETAITLIGPTQATSPEAFTQQLIESRAAEFDTLVASTEDLGALLIKYALGKGLSVPEQLQVAAFGDSGVSSWATPTLTLVDLKYRELAYRAARNLLGCVQTHKVSVPSALKLEGSPEPVLIAGATVRA